MCEKQRLNFYRVSRLLLEPCTDTLRYFFEKLYSTQGDLQSFLKIKVNKKRIKSLCQQSIITSDQKEILKPSNGTLPLLSNLDITLVCILLTNLCHHQVGNPQCGWAREPDDKDVSTAADILRLRKTRNKLFAHRTNAMMTDSDFQETWGKTCGVISRLSSHLDQKLQEDIQSNIDEISKAQVDPDTMYKLFDILFNQVLCKILDRIDLQHDHTTIENAYHDGAEEVETEMAKGNDGIICLIKLYPDLKSNMTRPSLTAIAKTLLDKKMISEDEYEQLKDTTKPRRCLTDMLLKKILRVNPEKTELLKCFFNRLRIHHPAMATKISQISVTEADRAAFEQVKRYGVVQKNDYVTSQNSCKMTDTEILFFEGCLCDSQEHVDRINDELLSKFLISISDHSMINQSDKKISTLFNKVQLYNLDVESVLECVLEQNMLEEWKTLRCEVTVTASLDQVMQDNGHVMEDKEIPNPCSTLENTVVHIETAMGDAKDDEMTNFCRFFLLVMDPGKLTLEFFLEKQYSSKGDLQLFLKSKEREVNILCSKCIIKQWQVDILQPTTGDVPTVQNLDISTICIILIYLCQITKPPNGWKELPSKNDRSTGADILRLLHATENLVFYRKAGGMSALEFNEKWNNIHGAISRLSVQLDEKEIDDIRRRLVLIREESIDLGKERKINNEIFKRFLPQTGENQEMKLGEIIAMDVDEVCSDQVNQGSFRTLLGWMRYAANAMMNRFARLFQGELIGVEESSIVLKIRVWKDLKVDLLDKDFVGKSVRCLIRKGCFESKVKLRGPVLVTVYILSPEAEGEKEEIHFHLELESIKHDVMKPRVHLKSQDMKLLVEEMDPVGLQRWIFDQLRIDVNKETIMNEIVSWQELSRCDQMEILLDSIKRLENGFDMLAQYCKDNDPYVYNKVFEKQEQLSCPEESDTDPKAVWSSYHKGGGLQKLYSMQLDVDVEEQGRSDLDLEKYWTADMVTQTEEQEYVHDRKENTGQSQRKGYAGDKATEVMGSKEGRKLIIPETSTQMKQVETFLDESCGSKGSSVKENMDQVEQVHSEASDLSILKEYSVSLKRRALPPGKKYHVFFCYSSSDIQWVKETVEKLEKDHGFDCCEYDRDNTPGTALLQFSDDSIRNAYKTLIVMTKEAFQSGFVLAEVDMAFAQGFEERRKCVVPVLLKDCEVPRHLRILNYVDARDSNRRNIWWPKLLAELETYSEQENMDKVEQVHSAASDLSILMECSVSLQRRALPPGKKYHVFFSYCSSDIQWVKQTVERLEEDHGFVCCEYDRDNTPGTPLLKFSDDSIRNAYKTLIVMTNEAFQSGFVLTEVDMAFAQGFDERRKCVVPVLLKDCEVPRHLRILNYVDARDSNRRNIWWPKLLAELETYRTISK